MADKKDTKDTQKDEPVKDLKDLGKATKEAAAEAKKEDTAASEPVGATASGVSVEEDAALERVAERDEQGRAYGTGRRKESIARVWLKQGTGQVIVNGKKQDEYFARKTHLLIINQPFLEIASVNAFDVFCTVKGGGLSGQAGAVRHGISRALEKFDPEYRPALKKAGMLTRDARTVERKKVGRHKARRSKQFSKR